MPRPAIVTATRASCERGPRVPVSKSVSILPSIVARISEQRGPLFGGLVRRPSRKGSGRLGERYGIGLGGGCGLSCGLPIFNIRVSKGIAVPCMTTDVSAIKNTK